jgi:hypothetical protein
MVDQVALPLTGAGDSSAAVATDRIGGREFQWVKVADGRVGETRGFEGAETTPGTTAFGLVVRNIPPEVQVVAQDAPWVFVGSVEVTSGIITALQGTSPWVIAGSVDVTSGSVGLSSGDRPIGVVAQGTAGSSLSPWWVISTGGGAGSTAVDANLTSAGSTKLIGTVNLTSGNQTIGTVAQGSPGSSAAPWWVISTAGGAGSTAVDANLTSAGSTKLIGVVGLSSGTQVIGTVAQGSPGSSAAPWWVISTAAAGAGSTAVDANLTSVGSTKTIGVVGQGPGSSAEFWFAQSIPFSSANTARTSVATSVNASVIAANANRKALLIANGSTAQMVGLGLSTNAVTTARANVNVYLQANSQLRFGLVGDLPLYTGPIRGINLTSTAVTGGVIVTEFT